MRNGKTTICFDGIDGCGKNTQIMLIRESFLPLPVKTLHFPGYTEFGSKMRELILETYDLPELPRQLLQWVDFLQTYYSFFAEQGIYILDRMPHYSSIAYGAALGVDMDILKEMRNMYSTFVPNITFILDIPAEVGAKRMIRSGKTSKRRKLNIIESRGEGFLAKVRNYYLDIQNLYPQEEPLYIINADRDAQEIHEEVFDLVKKHNLA